jgi:hypothetical protein
MPARLRGTDLLNAADSIPGTSRARRRIAFK